MNHQLPNQNSKFLNRLKQLSKMIIDFKIFLPSFRILRRIHEIEITDVCHQQHGYVYQIRTNMMDWYKSSLFINLSKHFIFHLYFIVKCYDKILMSL